ncbi:leucine-rich repeat domain-containing protein [Salinibacillus xinjiangensis]|uniref:Leucine-rich repeat domain-containing protein n=1 Tax=Salinibacillus xinjiangensis TaxID=1229268 RepID=A0A6G1X914_9BACI|nr:hypothetical protein [Salinibacillus xinjiangensis]MRG87395.1 hypothetical protein [Salinibacillus xinjiangensis]
MTKSNRNYKDAFDDYIGEEPLVKKEDKERFYRWLHQKEKKKSTSAHWRPKLATATLFVGAIVFSFIYLQDAFPQPEESDQPPVVEEEETIPFDQVREQLETIMSKYTVGMTKEEVQETFGQGKVYEGQSETDGSTYEAVEYQFIKTTNEKISLHPWSPDHVEYYINGDIGLSFNVVWEENGSSYAFARYLNEKGKRISTVDFSSDGSIYKDGKFIENDLYQIEASGFFVENVAASLQKAPEYISEEDLKTLQNLNIKPLSSTDRFQELLPHDYQYIKQMKSLERLYLKGYTLPMSVLKSLINLETLIIEDVQNLGFLEELAPLENLSYLDIHQTEITTVSGLVELKSLNQVVLNKGKVTDWEVLEENGIEVVESP